MNYLPRLLLLSVTLALTTISAGVQAAPVPLDHLSCTDFLPQPLAHQLMRSVWSNEDRALVRRQYSKHDFRLIQESGTNYGTAQITLKSTAPISGIRPRKLRATTCVDGCGLAIWELELGVLTPSEFKKLTTRTTLKQNTPESTDTELNEETVYLIKSAKGSYSLMCDRST